MLLEYSEFTAKLKRLQAGPLTSIFRQKTARNPTVSGVKCDQRQQRGLRVL